MPVLIVRIGAVLPVAPPRLTVTSSEVLFETYMLPVVSNATA